jgi:hypothetical protein
MKLILRLSLVVPWELDLTEERFDLRLFLRSFTVDNTTHW